MSETKLNGHLDDGTAISFLDASLSEADGKMVGDHVDSCAACAGLVAKHRDQLLVFRRALERTDFPVPAERETPGVRDRWPKTRWWAAAAALILITGVGVSPLRALVSDAIASVWEALAPPEERAEGNGGARPESAVSFVPDSDSLIVTFDRVRPGARVTVIAGDDAFVRASGVGSAELVVAGPVLRVRQGQNLDERFAVTIPEGLTRISFMVDGLITREFDRRELTRIDSDSGLVVQLRE